MKEETFNLVIDKLQKAHKLESKLSELGLSVMELNEGYHIAIKALLLELFSSDKIDVIDGSNAYINKKPYKIGGSYKDDFKNLVVNFN